MNAKPHIAVAILAYGSALTIQKHFPIYFQDSFFIVNELVSYSVLAFITILGALFPDLDYAFCIKDYINKDMAFYTRMKYHRQYTHSLIFWFGLFVFAIYFGSTILYFFVVGILSHLIADYLTGDIPLFFYGKREDKNELYIRKCVAKLENDKDISVEEFNDAIDENRRLKTVNKRYRVGVNYWDNGLHLKNKINSFSDNYYFLYLILGMALFMYSRL